ncbi:MAG: hypothetical protein PHV37_02270 [Candidatus Gastranaerophilales bacterium]|nr:hypothetical protein [Candidatus Gastranaerophilales bacterium]
MKKCLLVLAFIAFSTNLSVVFADCPTGYACLLKDIKLQQEVQNQMGAGQKKIIDDYYKIKFEKPAYQDVNDNDKFIDYSELMPFLPRYIHN